MKRRTLLQLLSSAAIAPLLNGAIFDHTAADDVPPGRLGLNLTGMAYWATEQAFSNLAFNASRWRLQVRGAPFTWDAKLPPMTPDGYPEEVPKGSLLESYLIFTGERKNLPARLSVHYDGKGRIGYTGGAMLEARSPGRDDVLNLRNDAPFSALIVETDPANPIRNIRLFEKGPIPEGRFREPFLQRLKGMSALRFMDWMGTNDSKIRHWSERPKPGDFGRSESGVPLEYMIELCNQTQAAPWFNIPHMADNDYVRRFAEQVKKNLDPDLEVHVEYSNEVWNSVFGQADYAKEKGMALGLSKLEFEAQLLYYAHRTNEVLTIWEDVFGSDKKRVVGVYAAQSANDWTSTTILSYKDVGKYADVLAVAPYFGGNLGGPERAEEVSRWSLDHLFSELATEIDTENKGFMEAQVAVARKFGLKLHAYEGGQHLVGHSGAENNDRLTDLFIAANRDGRMEDLYLRHFKNWWAAGGELYTVFSSMSEPSKWGSWGLLEKEGADNYPKWQAIQQLLKQKPSQ